MLVLQEFLQSNDAWQDEGEFTDDQGLEGDQSEETDGEWQESGSLQLEQQQKRQQVFFALLASFASCDERRWKKKDWWTESYEIVLSELAVQKANKKLSSR